MRSQYIPDQDERKPESDDIGVAIKGARTRALENETLSDGARVLFCYLLDKAVSGNTYLRFGSVLISTTKLCEKLKRCARAIYGYKRELVDERFIWISNQPMPNFWPMHIHHITDLDKPDHDGQMPTRDGLWGNGTRRQLPVVVGNGARQPGQKTLPLRSTECHRSEGGVTDPNSSVLAQNAPEGRTEGHPSAASCAAESSKLCGGEPQVVRRGAAKSAAESRTKCHPTAAQNATGQPHEQAVIGKPQITVKVSEKELLGRKAPPIAARTLLDVKDRLQAIEKRIKLVRSHEDNYELVLSDEVAKAVAWLKDAKNAKNKAELNKHLAEAWRRQKNRKNWVKGLLKKSVQRELEDLAAKKEQLEKQLAGELA